MADRLAVSQLELADLARVGKPTTISSMCTVFAESEVISLVGRGEPRENIARGVIDSVVGRVAAMASGTKGCPFILPAVFALMNLSSSASLLPSTLR